MSHAVTCLSVLLSLGLGAQAPATKEVKTPDPGVFFDDFSYGDLGGLAKNGWTIRTQKGWPGITGARWGTESFALVEDPAQPGNKLLRMISETDGSAAGTRQAQICQGRKYFEGTYAARVRFTDKPVSGPACDVVVETFYAFSNYERPMDPKYSELDFEYLPLGGWGSAVPIIQNTSWETVQVEPWSARNEDTRKAGPLEGWHVLMMQVSGGKVGYFMDGQRIALHGGKNYPRVPMSMNFNLWFTIEGVGSDKTRRVWNEDIDWAFHAKDQVLTPDQVNAAVAAYRKKGVGHMDTVPVTNPALPCPCDM